MPVCRSRRRGTAGKSTLIATETTATNLRWRNDSRATCQTAKRWILCQCHRWRDWPVSKVLVSQVPSSKVAPTLCKRNKSRVEAITSSLSSRLSTTCGIQRRQSRMVCRESSKSQTLSSGRVVRLSVLIIDTRETSGPRLPSEPSRTSLNSLVGKGCHPRGATYQQISDAIA